MLTPNTSTATQTMLNMTHYIASIDTTSNLEKQKAKFSKLVKDNTNQICTWEHMKQEYTNTYKSYVLGETLNHKGNMENHIPEIASMTEAQGSHRVCKTGKTIMVKEKSGNFILGQ